jgi:uncharacterized protein YfaQ (DUF2300 family)
MSEWTKFVSAFYKKKHASNPDYQFKDALKEASKVYKKGPSDGKAKSKSKSKTKKGGRSKKRRTAKKR